MNIVYGAMGRHGDIIAASIVANMLIRAGHQLKWVTIKYYEDLVKCICPDAEIGIRPFPEGVAWSDDVTREYLESHSPGADCYINAHLGAKENRDYWGSGKHPLEWLRAQGERATGTLLTSEWKKFLMYSNPIEIERIERIQGKPLAIIAPLAISSPCITSDLLEAIYSRLAIKYDVRILVIAKPDDCKYNYLYGYTFVECIQLLRQADHYVGQDSGMSWAALYSNCSKEIYHNKERFRTVRTSFAAIDGSAADYLL